MLDQLEEGLVDQAGRVEQDAAPVAGEVTSGDVVQLVVDEWHQAVHRQRVSPPVVEQQLGDLLGSGHPLSIRMRSELVGQGADPR